MKDEKLTARQTTRLLVMFIFGSTAIVGHVTGVEQDSWIALLLAAVISLPYFVLLGRLCKLYPEKEFFELVEYLFGKVLGKIIIVIMTWYAMHLCALVLRDFTEFVIICVMPETPPPATGNASPNPR